MANVLIIDDDEVFCRFLTGLITLEEHDVLCVHTLAEGLRLVSSEYIDIVFLDVILPDGNGLQRLSDILAAPSQPEVIILTGEGTQDGAELAIESGAWDYLQKTSSVAVMRLHLTRALQYRAERQKRTAPHGNLLLAGIHGNSARIKDSYDLLFEVAASDVNVLLTGETGTGKELFAQAIHKNSRRVGRNFIVVDCAALQGALIESTLFGHEKGAFTGADKKQEGLIKQCDGGTLFLDEIGELPLALQKVFLRVLQEHRFRPIGSPKEIESDFRLITATNRDIDAMAASGQFRQDLLYRLRSQVIHLPPLRERKEDIVEIATYHAAKICTQNGIDQKTLSPDFIDALLAYDWPGNIRELINAIDRAIAGALTTPTLFQRHLPRAIRVQLAQSLINESRPVNNAPAEVPGQVLRKLKDVRDEACGEIEKKYLQDLIAYTAGNREKACLISGLSQRRLYELLKIYHLSLKN